MYLKNTKTGELFCFNDRLAAKAGFIKVAKLPTDESKEPVSLTAGADSPEAAAAYALAAAAKKTGPRAKK